MIKGSIDVEAVIDARKEGSGDRTTCCQRISDSNEWIPDHPDLVHDDSLLAEFIRPVEPWDLPLDPPAAIFPDNENEAMSFRDKAEVHACR